MNKLILTVFFIGIAVCSRSEEQARNNSQMQGQGYVAQVNTPGSQTPVGLPQGSVRLQKVDIMDHHGFEQPMTAATLLIPLGWQTQGGIVWQPNMTGCGKRTPHFAWTAYSPDRQYAIEIIPEETWSGNKLQVPTMPQQSCPNVWITSAREYIQTWVQYNRPDARILDYRERRDFVEQLEQQLQQQQPVALPGSEMRQWAEGGQALISYPYQGHDMREIIGIAVMFSLFRMQGVMPNEIMESLTISTMPGYAMRAPAGQLDLEMAEMLRKSSRPNPQWLARMTQHNNKIAQINIKGARDRSKIIAQTGEEIRQMQRDSWNKYNASQDRMQREASEAIRGTETYNDPYHGGTVELDNTYEHAWQLNDGTYVLTNDPSFEPYRFTGQDGRRLEVTP